MTVVTLTSSNKKKTRGCCCDNITLLSVALIVGALCVRILVLDPGAATSRLVVVTKETQKKRTRTSVVSSYKSLVVDINHHKNLTPQQQEEDAVSNNNLLLPINPTSTLVSDIISIEHLPNEAAILVSLKSNGRCSNPYLRGRLSGPAIVLLEWTTTTKTTTKNEAEVQQHLYGHYHQVPISGTYYVEIIVIVCNDFSNDMEYDFSTTCLEDPSNHRLTKTNVKINIDNNNNKKKKKGSPPPKRRQRLLTGYWIHQQDERAIHNDYTALYTRYQPRGCLRLNDPSHEHFHLPPTHCIEPTNWNRFEPYNHFQYYSYYYAQDDGAAPREEVVQEDDHKFLRNAHEIQATVPTTICLVGGSHSRTLKASMINYHNFTVANNNIHIEWINAKFPRNVNNKTILEQMRGGKCNKIILAVGQWPASFSGNHPTKFRTYQMEMKKLLERLRHHLTSTSTSTTTMMMATATATPNIEIWTRSIHENPLNERIAGYCPPKDWRSPTVLDGYNTIIRQATEEANGAATTTTRDGNNNGNNNIMIRFIDTNFIVSPLWDCSTDWGHVCPQPSHVEALYLVAVVMGLIEPTPH